MPKKVEINQAVSSKIQELYEAKGWSMAKISRELKISSPKIKAELERLGIDLSTRKAGNIVIMDLAFSEPLSQNQLKKELIFSHKLFALAPDIRFWQHFDFKKHNVFTLGYFLTNYGKKKIAEAYKIFNIQIPTQERTEVGREKIGEDLVVARKPKSLMDFLND